MNIGRDSQVGAIASDDYCCAGHRTLGQACELKGADVEDVLSELREGLSESGSSQKVRWDAEPVEHLVQHILDVFHEPLRDELRRLEMMAQTVHRVHRSIDEERLTTLLQTLVALRVELLLHMEKEEQILFPMILSGTPQIPEGPMAVMELEHEDATKALATIRELTNDFETPPKSCATWQGLWDGLEDFDAAMREHIHLENDVLFPRVRGA
jgi:regulator of cell morphogenesis and NO signaling